MKPFLFALLLLCSCSPAEPFINLVEPNYSQDSNRVTYARYFVSNGHCFIDTAGKYHTWQHVAR